jgi:hypothetical protein
MYRPPVRAFWITGPFCSAGPFVLAGRGKNFRRPFAKINRINLKKIACSHFLPVARMSSLVYRFDVAETRSFACFLAMSRIHETKQGARHLEGISARSSQAALT